MVQYVQIFLNHFKVFIIIATIFFTNPIFRLQSFHRIMKTQQRQLQVNNHKPINLESVKKQSQLSKNESAQEQLKGKPQSYVRQDRYFSREQTKRTKPNIYHWTSKENLLYKKFLQKNLKLLEADLYDRRVNRINVLMSQRIKTRTSNQCRSHHQKMMKRHETVAGVIKFIEDMWNDKSPVEIKQRNQEKGIQSPAQNSSIQQKIEKLMEDEMVHAQYKIQEIPQIETFPLEEISQIQIEVSLRNYEIQSISDYFQPKLWWDGMEI